MSMYEIILAKFALIMKKLAQVNASEQKVYNAGYEKGKAEGGYEQGVADGKQAEYDAFWDVYQNNGARDDYQYAFGNTYWRDATFKPKYNLVLAPGYSGTNMFWNSRITNIEERLKEMGVVLDTSKAGYLANMFYNAQTEAIPVLDIRNATNVNSLVRNCTAKTVRKLIVSETVPFVASTFQDSKNLENIIFEGVIAQNGLNLQWSTKLSRSSIESVIFALDLTEGRPATTVTLSLVAVNKAFETIEGANDGASSGEFSNLCASARVAGWTISLV